MPWLACCTCWESKRRKKEASNGRFPLLDDTQPRLGSEVWKGGSEETEATLFEMRGSAVLSSRNVRAQVLMAVCGQDKGSSWCCDRCFCVVSFRWRSGYGIEEKMNFKRIQRTLENCIAWESGGIRLLRWKLRLPVASSSMEKAFRQYLA